ncbi:MAG: exonuclease domain-containing protein, partial [Pseudomonadota bacterium]
GKPGFAEIADAFMQFFGEGTLIAHNAQFDMGFVNAELERIGRPAIANDRVTDSLTLARRKFPGAKNDLDTLCNRFRISNAHRTLHGALLDAQLLQEVYIELTGGQQVGFALESGTTEVAKVEQAAGPARKRPTALPDPRTDETRAAHAAFVESLGPDAIWQRHKA